MVAGMGPAAHVAVNAPEDDVVDAAGMARSKHDAVLQSMLTCVELTRIASLNSVSLAVPVIAE